MDSAVATPPDQPDTLGLGPDAAEIELASGRSVASGRSQLLARTLLSADILAAMTAATAVAIASGVRPATALLLALGAGVVWPGIAFAFGLYGGDDLRSWVSGVAETPTALVAALLYTWPLFGAAFLLEIPSPAIVTGGTLLATVLLSSGARATARATLHRAQPLRQRTVIVGSGVVAGKLVEKLRTHEQFGLEPIGIVDDELHTVGSPDLPLLGGFSDLAEVLHDYDVDRVMIAFSRASHEQLLQCIRACRDGGVAVDVVPRLFEFLYGVRSLNHVGGLPVLSIGTARLTRSSQIAKRLLDIVIAGLVLVVLSPLLLLIAATIRLESRGPVFFRQPRAGQGGQMFQVIKFRSMYADAEQRKQEFQRQNDLSDGVMFKIHGDPRITTVGRFLRRFSLDEVPQLLNVVRGEMSLVGPRPLILPETDALADWQLRRLDLRPGLTGPWQVHGRSETPFHEMVRFDYQYVAGWSLARDVEILLATVPAVISGRGAY
jgi:exopolysaccharide biosynthesis polyprenyl glycosylphosphotransferase